MWHDEVPVDDGAANTRQAAEVVAPRQATKLRSVLVFLWPLADRLDETRRGGSVDGMFVSGADNQHISGGLISLAIDDTEPLRTSARCVELHSGQAT